jgi:hypothetical protein
MFEVPESDIISVRIDEDAIEGKKPIEYVRAIEKKEQKPVEKIEKENNLDNEPPKIVHDFYPGEEIRKKSSNKIKEMNLYSCCFKMKLIEFKNRG